MRLLGLAALVGLVSILAVLAWPGREYRHADFFQFWAAPRMVLEGSDPYDREDWAAMYAREAAAPVATPPPPGRHIYPAWNTVLMLPLGAVPLDVAAAFWLVAQLSVVALALRALARVFLLDRAATFVLFGLALGSQPLWLMIGGGNTTGFLFGLLAAGLIATVRGAPRWAGFAIALLALKPHPFLVTVPALIAASHPADRLRLLLAAIVTGGVLVAFTLPLGTGWVAAWFDAVVERAEVPGSNATVWTLERVLPVGEWIGPLLAVASIGAFALWWRRRDPAPANLVAGAVPISLFVAPHGWSYDQLHLLVTYAAVLGSAVTIVGTRRIAVLTATALVAGLLPWVLYAIALARGGEEWSAITPLLALALLVIALPRSRPSPG